MDKSGRGLLTESGSLKPVSDISRTSERKWYVMQTRRFKSCCDSLAEENILRQKKGLPPLDVFFPYALLTNNLESDGEASSEATAHPDAMDKRVITSIRNFVFVKATLAELRSVVFAGGESAKPMNLWFYNSRDNRHITVTEQEMRLFVDVCCNTKLKLEVVPTMDDFKENERVILNTTELKGREGYVLKVYKGREGTSLHVAVTMFSRLLTVKLVNLKEHDVIRPSQPQGMKENRLIDVAKAKILDIMTRRCDDNYDENQRAKDEQTLSTLYNFSHYRFDTPAKNRAFLAMMLICAHLRRDKVGCQYFCNLVLGELNDIEQIVDKQKVMTDVYAYLLVAAYMATGKPVYRNSAKVYVQQYQPKSSILRRFVAIIRKRRLL